MFYETFVFLSYFNATQQKSKYKVDFNFIFISIEKQIFGHILHVLEKIRKPIKIYSTRAIMHS